MIWVCKWISRYIENGFENFASDNNGFQYEKDFLRILAWLYILSLPFYLILFFASMRVWNVTFNEVNGGYLMAALLLVFPYLYNRCLMVYELLRNTHKYLNDTPQDLRRVMGFEQNSMAKLYLDGMYILLGAAAFTMLIYVTIIPVIYTIPLGLVEGMLFILKVIIWIEVIRFLVMLAYLMRYGLYGPYISSEKRII